MIGTRTINKAAVTTYTMYGVIRNLTKGLGSRYYTMTIPLDGRSLSLSVDSNPKGTIQLLRAL